MRPSAHVALLAASPFLSFFLSALVAHQCFSVRKALAPPSFVFSLLSLLVSLCGRPVAVESAPWLLLSPSRPLAARGNPMPASWQGQLCSQPMLVSARALPRAPEHACNMGD